MPNWLVHYYGSSSIVHSRDGRIRDRALSSNLAVWTRRCAVPGHLVEWPLRYGPVPPLADASSPRPESGLGLVGKLSPGDTLILTPAGQPGSPRFPEHGGTGKTQLAAALAHGLWDNRSVDLLVWLGASSRDAILSGYAAALADVGAADPDDDLLGAARRFLAWLRRTERRWVVVLDDLADPADLDGLWPEGTDGRVVITARHGDSLDGPNRRIIPVGSFTMREALAYLTARLSTDPGQRTEALDLATDLDRQPLALAHATAALISTGASCRDYRGWYQDRRRRLAPRASGTEPGPVDVTWSLAWTWPTRSRPPAWPGRCWRWPRCSIQPASPGWCSPARPRAGT